MPRALAYETLRIFARRYRIPLTYTCHGVRRGKTFRLLNQQIYDFEQSHGIRNGLHRDKF
jgi:hypothetical protein